MGSCEGRRQRPSTALPTERRKCREGSSDVHFLPHLWGTSCLPDPPLGFEGCRARAREQSRRRDFLLPPQRALQASLLSSGKGKVWGGGGCPRTSTERTEEAEPRVSSQTRPGGAPEASATIRIKVTPRPQHFPPPSIECPCTYNELEKNQEVNLTFFKPKGCSTVIP